MKEEEFKLDPKAINIWFQKKVTKAQRPNPRVRLVSWEETSQMTPGRERCVQERQGCQRYARLATQVEKGVCRNARAVSRYAGLATRRWRAATSQCVAVKDAFL